MTELPPQDPWRGQAPPPPPPPPPPYDPTMAFAPPRPSWWRRQTTAVKVLLVSGVAVLACCGGLMGIGIAAGPPTPEPSESPKTAAPQDVQAVAPSITTEASPAEPSPTTAAPTSAKPSPKPSPKKTKAPEVYYKNCDAVRDAGAAPLHRGDPGYRTGLDRDLDGEACEPDGGNGDTGGGDSGGGDSGGGDNDPRFSTCAEAKSHGYGPYHQGEDPEYYWYIDRDNDGDVCE